MTLDTSTARSASDRLAHLLRREHEGLADFLVALAEFDRQRLWEPLGYVSLFAYLHRELGVSKGSAQYRKVAAELILELPAVADALRSGQLCFTSVIEAARVVTAANWETVLPRFFGLSRREAMGVVAELQPVAVVPARTVVTGIPRCTPTPVPRQARDERDAGREEREAPRDERETGWDEREAGRDGRAAGRDAPRIPRNDRWLPTAPCDQTPSGLFSSTVEPAVSTPREPCIAPRSSASALPAPPPPRTTEVVPLTAHDRRLHITVSDRFLGKLAAAADALGHSMPGATEEAILEAGLDLLLDRAAKRRGQVAKPREESATAKPVASRRRAPGNGSGRGHIPASVRRAVWARDAGRCQWSLDSGGICGSTRRLQQDHVVPLALGGESTIGNTRLLCRAHNLLAARLTLGDGLMARYTRSPGPASASASPRPVR